MDAVQHRARPGRRDPRATSRPSAAGFSSTARWGWAATPRRCCGPRRTSSSSASTATPQALARAGERLAVFGPRVRLVQANFHQLAQALAGLGHPRRNRGFPGRSRRFFAAARDARAGLQLPLRRASRHADGFERNDRGGPGQPGLGGRVGDDLQGVWRGAAGAADRPGDRARADGEADRDHGRAPAADRRRQGGAGGARGADRSRHPRLPGAAHRGQPGAGRPRALHRGGGAAARRPAAGWW